MRDKNRQISANFCFIGKESSNHLFFIKNNDQKTLKSAKNINMKMNENSCTTPSVNIESVFCIYLFDHIACRVLVPGQS